MLNEILKNVITFPGPHDSQTEMWNVRPNLFVNNKCFRNTMWDVSMCLCLHDSIVSHYFCLVNKSHNLRKENEECFVENFKKSWNLLDSQIHAVRY